MRLPIYSVASARAIDAAAIAGGISGYALMCRAGDAAFGALRNNWSSARKVLVLCGPGNNGGDGLVLARLAKAAGFTVNVLATRALAPRGEAAEALVEWQAAGGKVDLWQPGTLLPEADVIVDALFGIGLTRAPDADAAALIEAANAYPAPICALDVPSGVDADTGAVPGVAIRAASTLCFIAIKPGLATGAALEYVGALELAPLGVPESAFADQQPVAEMLDFDDSPRPLPRSRTAHKGQFGHVLVLGGEIGMGGAARLCAEAALRCGAGLVSVGTRAEHVAAHLAARPECMVTAVESAEDLPALIERASVLAIGPGLGRGDWGRALLHAALREPKPCVLDADALNLLAEGEQIRATAILTPHPGEASRLLQCSTAEVEADRLRASAAIAARFGAVVVLKGAGSVVCAPDGRCRVIIGGNPGMATGGMGDVLTGVIAALRAQGLDDFDAAVCGAALHAAAGDAAAEGGHIGLLASDLMLALRHLLSGSP